MTINEQLADTLTLADAMAEIIETETEGGTKLYRVMEQYRQSSDKLAEMMAGLEAVRS